MLLVHLFVLHVLVFVLLTSSWCRGFAAVCDYGTPWTFLLSFIHVLLVIWIVFILNFHEY